MAKKKLSRDQKRKQKLQKRAHSGGEARQPDVSEEFMRDTERIIHETFMSFRRGMFDADVRAALNQLIVDVQQGMVSMEHASAESPNAKGALVWNIKQHWSDKRTLDPLPRLVAAQALQALAQKVDGIEAPGESQSYLRFLQGTMDGAAALVVKLDTEATTPNGAWAEDEARLLELGKAWLRDSNAETWRPFHDETIRMTEGGQARAVANVCQYLYGLVQAQPVEMALHPVLDAAHQKLGGGDHQVAETPSAQ